MIKIFSSFKKIKWVCIPAIFLQDLHNSSTFVQVIIKEYHHHLITINRTFNQIFYVLGDYLLLDQQRKVVVVSWPRCTSTVMCLFEARALQNGRATSLTEIPEQLWNCTNLSNSRILVSNRKSASSPE